MKKILSVVLAALMLTTLAVNVLAGGMILNSNHGAEGTFGMTVTLVPVEDDEVKVIFMGGDNYTLVPKTGTTLLEDDSIAIVIKKGESIPSSLIPSVAGDDQYYQASGYYIKANGASTPVNPTTYNFADKTTYVYATVVDTWTPFTDMKQDRSDWYYSYVRNLSIAGVVNGYPDGSFHPNGDVKWGEALKMICLACGIPAQTATDAHWASGYLTYAKANGLVDAEAEVDLEAAITRLDYATIVAKALGLAPSAIETPFEDTEDGYVLALYENLIIEGSLTAGLRYFKPDKGITRAEMSTVIYRLNQLGK